MKSLFSVLLAATSLVGSLHAQQGQPFYLLYNAGCMSQLDYRYTYKNTAVGAFSVRPNADELYVLTAGGQNITTTMLPRNAVRCQDLNSYENFMEFVNAQRNAPVYIVYQTPEGYAMTEIVAAYKITRQGSYYILQAKDFSFAVDTLRPTTGVNLALNNSGSYIFLNGQKTRGCLTEYSFRRESPLANQEITDFDFIPGIGITNDRTGLNAAQAESNQVRLVAVNGRYLDDHITAVCQNRPAPTSSNLSQWANPITYTTDSRVQPEYDKETMSIIRKTDGPLIYNTEGLPTLADCPEPPGEGYHIVQPGEGLSAIARTYEVSLKDVLDWNKIKDADRIQPCQKIWIVKPPAGAVIEPRKSVKPVAHSTAAKSGPTVQHQGIYWKSSIMTAKSTEPIVYFSPNKTTPAPLNTTQNPIHIVKTGETLYSIARYYALTEEKLRSLNGLPLQGDVLLRPGDQLLICECKTNDEQPAPDPTRYNYYNNNPTPTPSANTVNSLGITIPATDNRPVGYEYQQQPAADTRPVFDDRVPVSGKDKPLGGQTPGATRSPVYQYYVNQGDTIGSIAVKFRVSADELALINNKQVNETLISGQRILIPKY